MARRQSLLALCGPCMCNKLNEKPMIFFSFKMSQLKSSKRENNLVQKITFIHKYFAARALKKVLFTLIPFIPFPYVDVEAYTSLL